MDEIRIWKITEAGKASRSVQPLEVMQQTTTEELLEDILTASPDILMPNLHIVGRQTETPGGPLDLLGVDEDGRLVVFELKRGKLTRDAVAQAIDYASYLADLDSDQLCQHITETSGKNGAEKINDFAQWYQSTYQVSVTEIGRPRIVLVGLSADERTKRMVEFLAQAEIDISLLTFHAFQHDGQTLLARQVEVKARETTASVKSTKVNNQAKLDDLLVEYGLKNQFEAVGSAIATALGDSAYRWPNTTGYTYYLMEVTENGHPSNRAYLSLYLPERHRGYFQVQFQPRAIEAVGTEELENFAKAVASKLTIRPSGYGEVLIEATKALSELMPAIAKLGQLTLDGWKRKMKSQD